ACRHTWTRTTPAHGICCRSWASSSNERRISPPAAGRSGCRLCQTVDEASDHPGYLIRMFVDDPVRSLRQPLDAQLPDVALQAVEVSWQQKLVLLTPYHEHGDVDIHGARRGVGRSLLRRRRGCRGGAIVAKPSGQRAG